MQSLGGYVFQYSKNLKYVYAPGVTKLYIAAFANCPSITKVLDTHPTDDEVEGIFLPNLTETVGFAFSGCSNLENVSLSKLAKLGTTKGYDFQSCTNLKNANLPFQKMSATRN